MKLEINGGDLVLIPVACLLAYYVDWKWSGMLPLIVLGWFVLPRWSKAEGWRFLR